MIFMRPPAHVTMILIEQLRKIGVYDQSLLSSYTAIP
jgi:hypothetical protein